MNGPFKGSGKPASGPGRTSGAGPYKELDRSHEAVRAKMNTEAEMMRTAEAVTRPDAAKAKAPAVVIGNNWVEHAKAWTEQVHAKLFGQYPILTPKGGMASAAATGQRPQARRDQRLP